MIKSLVKGVINILNPSQKNPQKKEIVSVKETLEWIHCEGEKNYTVIMPPNQEAIQDGDPALMCCVIKHRETGECRLIPYMNIPLLFHRNIEVKTSTHKGQETAYLSYDLPEY